jgi:hypothetical protein
MAASEAGVYSRGPSSFGLAEATYQLQKCHENVSTT